VPADDPAERAVAGRVRLRLDLGYDGTDFAGWARQPGLRTVEGVLEQALARVLRLDPPPRLTVAGRTDAGVHARGQVAHVDVPGSTLAAAPGRSSRTPADALLARLAGVLPPDVRVRRVGSAGAGFDARFSALWRRYAYRVSDAPWGVDPMRRREVAHHRRPLDVAAMSRAAAALLGEHDFAAFCRRRPGATTVRNLVALDWAREADGVAVATVRADAFCHSMVRALVGALLAVGDGRRPPHWPAGVLAAAARDPAVTVMPSHGLCLEEVGYPSADRLAARAEQARQPRATPPRSCR